VARVLIGEDDQGIELIFEAEGFRRLAENSTKAVAEMDSLFEQEEAAREAASGTAGPSGDVSEPERPALDQARIDSRRA
jgi:hypothetical protein